MDGIFDIVLKAGILGCEITLSLKHIKTKYNVWQLKYRLYCRMPVYKPVLIVLLLAVLAAPCKGYATYKIVMGNPATLLDSLIESGRKKQSPATYFARLYYTMRTKIGEGITSNTFTDSQLVRFIHTKFAEKYLTARLAFEQGDPVPSAWKAAFDTSGQLSYVQLLALGTNAHINHDLYFILKEYYTLHPESAGNYKVTCREIFNISAEETERVMDRFLETDTSITGFNRLLIKIGRGHIKNIMRNSLDATWRRAIEATTHAEKAEEATQKQLKLVEKNTRRFMLPQFLMKKGFNILKGLDRLSFETKVQMLAP